MGTSARNGHAKGPEPDNGREGSGEGRSNLGDGSESVDETVSGAAAARARMRAEADRLLETVGRAEAGFLARRRGAEVEMVTYGQHKSATVQMTRLQALELARQLSQAAGRRDAGVLFSVACVALPAIAARYGPSGWMGTVLLTVVTTLCTFLVMVRGRR